MAKRTHYNVLGVDRDADAEMIKQAYRNKARNAHPDKGGDAAEMAEVNQAYEVLSDPERRLLYDRTGQDRQRSVEDEARNVVLQAFAAAVEGNAHHCLSFAKDAIKSKRQEFEQQKAQLVGVKDKLVVQREKISVKNGDNLFHMLIDQKMAGVDAAIADFERRVKVCDASLKILKSYKSTEQAAKTVYFSMTASTSSTF